MRERLCNQWYSSCISILLAESRTQTKISRDDRLHPLAKDAPQSYRTLLELQTMLTKKISNTSKPDVSNNPLLEMKASFEKLQLDFAGPFLNNVYILVVINIYSKYPSALPTKTIIGEKIIEFVEGI